MEIFDLRDNVANCTDKQEMKRLHNDLIKTINNLSDELHIALEQRNLENLSEASVKLIYYTKVYNINKLCIFIIYYVQKYI